MKTSNVNNKQRASQEGFTLVEIAVVMIILSIIIAPIFTIFTQQGRMKDVRQDEAINSQVLSALATYLKENGAYPCPANPTLAQNNAAFGDAGAPGVCAGSVAAPGGLVVSGDLPVRDLSIPARSAANVHGWKHIYAVTLSLTDPVTFNGLGEIDLLDEAGALFSSSISFVVVNTGVDGKGSRSLQGTPSGTAAPGACGALTARDAENCDNDSVFREMPRSITNSDLATGYFDDTLSYTLARKESTMWLLRRNTLAGSLDIVNRNVGNVGIGTFAAGATPIAKLHVEGGDVLIQPNAGTGGNLDVDGNVSSQSNIVADDTVRAGVRVESPSFFYAPTP